jgi:hypothetical protein
MVLKVTTRRQTPMIACERTPRAVIGLSLSAVMLLLPMVASAARADAPSLRVTNLGQPSAPVEVGQPPIEIAATAACAYPFTIANEGACPPGSWPALGRQWGPIEDVAGGDSLRLEFSAPVTTVKAGSTSNYEPGLKDPDGKPISNYDVMAESPATSTSDPAVWLVPLPQLDARAISSRGYTFSVVAQDGAGYHDYPFGIRSPRYANELTQCGLAYYSTGWQQYLCLGKMAPTGGAARRLKISRAVYDGRTITLRVAVPGEGKLKVGIPASCGVRAGGDCNRRTWLSRHAKRRGTLVIRKALSLRLGRGNRIAVPMRFRTKEGVSATTSKVKVHLTPDAT